MTQTPGAAAESPAAADPLIHGSNDPRFAAVRDVFADNFARGEEVGAAVAVYAGDRLVVDLWGGIADRKTGRMWERDTPCLAYSCTKAVTAACAALLWERGAYEVDGPVRHWWPEFAAAGKQDATAAHLLTHSVGLPAFEERVTVAQSHDPAAMAGLLARQAPLWEPGSDHGYHAITYGWLAGEIVRRLSGRPVGEFAKAEFAGDLDMWLGAPAEVRAGAAKMTVLRPPTGAATSPVAEPAAQPAAPARPDDVLTKMAAAAADPQSLLNRALGNPAMTDEPEGANSAAVLSAGWPAAGLVTTARALAGFYRDLSAGRIISADTLRAAIEPRVSGPDRVLFVDSSFGLGFMRPSLTFLVPPAGRRSAFGHTGAGGSIGLADLDHGLTLAYVMNGMANEVSGGLRAYRLVEAMYRSVE